MQFRHSPTALLGRLSWEGRAELKFEIDAKMITEDTESVKSVGCIITTWLIFGSVVSNLTMRRALDIDINAVKL